MRELCAAERARVEEVAAGLRAQLATLAGTCAQQLGAAQGEARTFVGKI